MVKEQRMIVTDRVALDVLMYIMLLVIIIIALLGGGHFAGVEGRMLTWRKVE